MKGRKKIPDSLKTLRGTDQPCRMSNSVAIPPTTAVVALPRTGLKGTAKKIFAVVATELIHKGLLDVAGLAVGAEKSLQSADVLAVRPHRQIDAGVERLAVDEHGAGTALAHLAALFHGGHVIVVAEHIRQAGADIHHLLHVLAVDITADQLILLAHTSSPPASSMDFTKQRLAISTAIC